MQSVDGSKASNLTPKPEKPEKPEVDAPPKEPKDADKKEETESFTPLAFSRDAAEAAGQQQEGLVRGHRSRARGRDLIVPLDEDEDKNPRLSADRLGARRLWNLRHVVGARQVGARRSCGSTSPRRRSTPVVRDSRLYNGIRLSHDGSTFVFTMSDGDHPADLHVADARFTSVRKLSDVNPWLATKAAAEVRAGGVS